MRFVPVLGALVLMSTLTPSLLAQDSRSTKPVAPKEILGRTVAEWVKDLEDKDPAVRVKATQIITNFGESARGLAGPVLIEKMKNDRDASMRVNCVMAIQSIGLDEKDVMKAVAAIQVKLPTEQQAFVRYHLTMLAAQIGLPARGLLNDLVGRARDQGSYEIRKAAIYAIGSVGKAGERGFADSRAVAALIDTFAGGSYDASAEVRLEAVISLGDIGNVTEFDRAKIVAALKRAANDKEKTIGIWANVGLMAHDRPDEKYMTAVTKHLRPNEPYPMRLQATRALGALRSKSKGEVDELVECLSDKEPLFVALVVWSLGEIGDDAEKAVPALQELEKKKDTNEAVKTAVKAALEKITGKKRDS